MWKSGWATRDEVQDIIKDVKSVSEVGAYLCRRMREDRDHIKNRSIIIETAELLHKFPEMMLTNTGLTLYEKVLSKLDQFPEFEEYTDLLTHDIANIEFVAKPELEAYFG